MLRTALKPRWLALLVVVLLAASGMAWLGQWQLDRARERSAAAERARLPKDPVGLGGVLKARETFPGTAVDELVVATGRWDPAHQVLVAGRALEGADGFWVLTPLRLADGSAVAVVRGWVTGPDDPAATAAPAGGEVRVTGRLRPSEPPVEHDPGVGSGLPAGQVERVAVPVLIQQWPYPLLTGYVVATAASPADPAPPRPVPAEPQGGGLALQNLSYALQWWLFAGCGLFLWGRLVRDDHLGRPILRRPDDPPADPGDDLDQPVGEDEAPMSESVGRG